MWTEIARHISQITGKTFDIKNRRSVSGSCINQGYAVSSETDTYFVKLNRASQVEMFEAEALGLKQMLETKTIRVPKPIGVGTAGDSAYIVMEWLEFGGSGKTQDWEEMGRKLAQMHQTKPPQPNAELNVGKLLAKRGESPVESSKNQPSTFFGWGLNNTIGSTPQINTWTPNWATFFTEHRLGYQFTLAQRRGGAISSARAFISIGSTFAGT